MKYALSLIALASSASAVTTTMMVCNANNCLRAVRASAVATRSGSADCSSFFLATATPDTVTFYEISHQTTTTTVDTIVTLTVGLPTTALKKREVVEAPTAIPAYASACSGAIGYSSACSCIGVTASTITVAAPSTTITASPTDITATATSTVATVYATTARVIYQDGYPGQYLASSVISGSTFVVPTAAATDAPIVTIQPDGTVTAGGKLLVGVQSTVTPQGKFLLWVTPADPLPAQYTPVTCSFGGGNQFLCTVSGFNVFGSYTGADHKDTLRLFSNSFTFNPSIYKGPLHLFGV